MGTCSYCGKSISIPFHCKRCGKNFCSEHRLPESHNCIPSIQYNDKRKPYSIIYQPKSYSKPKASPKKGHSKYKPIQPAYIKKTDKTPILAILAVLFFVVVFSIMGLNFLTRLGIYPLGFLFTNPSPSQIVSPTLSIDKTIYTAPTSSYSNIEIPTVETTLFKPVDTFQAARAILRFTNEQRNQNGLPSLQWDENLAAIAHEHSKDMADNNYFAHNNLRGEGPTERAIRHGINVRKYIGNNMYTDGIGENIGKMPTGNVLGVGYVSNDIDKIAEAQVTSWMNSPGHRSNILNRNYDRIGVGVAYDGSLYYFSTQDFQ